MDRFSYQAVVRLYAIAAENWWAIDGTCARNGVDPGRLAAEQPHRFCNLIYAWAAERLQWDADAWRKWQVDLTSPLPKRARARVSAKTAADEMAQFRRFARETQ